VIRVSEQRRARRNTVSVMAGGGGRLRTRFKSRLKSGESHWHILLIEAMSAAMNRCDGYQIDRATCVVTRVTGLNR